MRRRLLGWCVMLTAGALFFFVTTPWWKAVLVLIGTVLVNLSMNMLTIDVEKARGDID